MEYRFLGRSGLQVSLIGFGNMINVDLSQPVTTDIIKRAFDLGINFFDTAEGYDVGKAEVALGTALKKHNIPREQIVVSDKLFFYPDPNGNQVNRVGTLSRKHVIEGTNAALKRLQLDYVDIMFAHSFDADTPIEEICRGFNQIIENGQAFYWGTSNWPTSAIVEAHNVCERLGLIAPVAEQCEYNMLNRQKFEVDFGYLYDKFGMGTTIWSPLAGGILTGKYNDHVPEESRLTQGIGFFPKELIAKMFFNKHLDNPKTIQSLKALGELAKEIGSTQAQLALAWALRNKDVSTAIIGARSIAQLEDTVQALEVYKKFTPELEEKVEKILGNRPTANMDWRQWKPLADRR